MKFERVEIGPGQTSEFPCDFFMDKDKIQSVSVVYDSNDRYFVEFNRDYAFVPLRKIANIEEAKQKLLLVASQFMKLDLLKPDQLINPFRDDLQGLAILSGRFWTSS